MNHSNHHHHHHGSSSNNNNNNNNTNLEYPNLTSCTVSVLSENAIIELPPIRLPNDILQMVSNTSTTTTTIPKPIDFTTEHRVLKKKVERDIEFGTANSMSNKDDLRHNLIARMKSLTNATEDICVSILQRNSYDLETSVEAYLSNSQSQL